MGFSDGLREEDGIQTAPALDENLSEVLAPYLTHFAVDPGNPPLLPK